MAYQAISFTFGEIPSAAKWNIIGTNDASFNDGTGIADGSITPNHLKASSSTLDTWEWDTWTPTWTNLTVSGSTVVATYTKTGMTIHFHVHVTLGGGNAPTGLIGFSPPVNASSNYANSSGAMDATVTLLDTGIALYFGILCWGSASRFDVYVQNVGATYMQRSATSATVPVSWGNGDYFEVNGTYRAA